MKKSNHKYIYSLLLVIGCSAIGFTQKPTRLSEKEINVQKIYIEANKEKLLGNDEDAIILFSEVIRKQPTNDAAAYELAKLYLKTGDKSKALNYAQKAVNISPANVWYSTYFAEILAENGEYDQAAKLYESLVTQYPDQYDFYFEWAYMFIKGGNTDEAIGIYNKIEDRIGVNERTTKRKYSLYLVQGKNKKAEAELQKLVKAFPSESLFYQLLAEFYDQQNRSNDAKEIYKKMLEIDPDDPVANLALAESFKESGDDERFLNSIQDLFKNPDVNIDIKIKEIVPYITKMPEYANKPAVRTKILDLGKTLTDIHSDEPKAFSVYGDLLYHADENELALKAYERTLELDKSVFMVWEQMMYIQSGMGLADELLKTSENTMDLFPNQAVAYFMSGKAYAMKKEYSDAVDAFDQALMMSSRDKSRRLEIYTELGAVYHYQKKYEKSNEAFEDALRINPRDVVALNNYSALLCERGENLEKALQMSNSVNQLVPNKPLYQHTYGWILYKQGDYEMAERWLKKAVDFGGNNTPYILEHYGDALFQSGKVSEAVEYWQQAQQKGGSSPLLEKKIADKKLYEQ